MIAIPLCQIGFRLNLTTTGENASNQRNRAPPWRRRAAGLVERAKTTPPPPIIIKKPHMLLAQGAIVIKIGEEFVAALGVSGAPGGEKDEACARAALDKVSVQLK